MAGIQQRIVFQRGFGENNFCVSLYLKCTLVVGTINGLNIAVFRHLYVLTSLYSDIVKMEMYSMYDFE